MYLLSGGFDTNRHVEHEIQRDYKDFPFGCKGFGLTQPNTFCFSMWCKKRVWAFSHHSAMENPIPFYVFPFQWGHLPSLTTAHPLQRVTRSRGARFTRDLWGQTAWWQCWASVSLKPKHSCMHSKTTGETQTLRLYSWGYLQDVFFFFLE